MAGQPSVSTLWPASLPFTETLRRRLIALCRKPTLQRACAQTGRTSTLTWPHLTHQFARAVLDISVLQADELPAQAESIGA